MRAVRGLRKHWKPYWKHARYHERTWREQGRAIVALGFILGYLARDRWQAYLMLWGLWMLLVAASVCHWIRCYRESLRTEDDKPQDGDRFEIYTADDIWRWPPWLGR